MRASLPSLLLYLLLLPLTSGQAWPDCVTHSTDYTGLDLLSGLRFSSEDCALWCHLVGSDKCLRWVFRETGSTCFLKGEMGLPRDENDPLTAEDRAALEAAAANATTTTAAAPTTTAATTTAPPPARRRREVSEAEQALIEQRVEELQKYHTGLPDCVPVQTVTWPSCAQVDKMIDGEDVMAEDGSGTRHTSTSTTMESCSLECLFSASCQHWAFHTLANVCYLKTGNTNVVETPNVMLGSKECVGKVDETIPVAGDSSFLPVDGQWSPWSTLDTPCINLKTGQRVDCGGGFRKRYRSCTNPRPRYGGNVCPGPSEEEAPCNLHSCQLPETFLWSPWGSPEIDCILSTQKRTTLCGSVRRKLPQTNPNPNQQRPAVYWPSCIVMSENTSPTVGSPPPDGGSLAQCFNGCKLDAACKYWTFNRDGNVCTFHDLLKIVDYEDRANWATGEKECVGEVYAPHCGEYQTDYPGAPVLSEAAVDKYADCADNCTNSPDCHNWFLTIKADGVKMCTLRGEIPADNSASAAFNATDATGLWAFFGPKASCAKAARNRPAGPEEAEELSYKETCQDNQYEEETRELNAWDKERCPSPCKDNGPCPKGAQCFDLSDSHAPQHECICQMGMVMEGGRCIAPPMTTPTPRPRPQLSPAAKGPVTAFTRMICTILILFLLATLIVFACFKVHNTGRFIHVNLEVALLLAHVCLIPTLSEDESACRNISICIHFFFTAVFAFFLVEGVHMYSLVSHVVKKGGMLSNMGNFVVGWGIAVTVIAFTVSFEYESYGGEYHCWLQIDSGLIYGQYLPIIILCVMTIMLVEAGSSVDEETMTKLPDTDDEDLISAHYSLKSLLLRLCLTLVSFVVGTWAEYEQNLGLYFVFMVVNAILGAVIFIGHCCCDRKIRGLLTAAKEKICGKKPEVTETETEALVVDQSDQQMDNP